MEASMQVREIMTPQCQTCGPEDTLNSAARAMASLEIGSLPVANNNRLVGMLTDRDIAVRAAINDLDAKHAKVGEAMTNKVYYCFDDQTTEEVAQNMAELQVRRLPVVNREKELVGIVSMSDFPSLNPSK
jgi:CBS domain-containing protein